jgi:hypothetical protein
LRCSSRSAVLTLASALALTSGISLAGSEALAQADPIGGVIVIPSIGTDLTPIRLRTSSGCPAKANAFYAKMRGHELPPDGQVITANSKAGMSHSFGFDVYVAEIPRDYATDNHTTLTGRYDITVFCINRITLQSYGEFTGSLQFTSPTHYEALGAAKPTGPPPPPLAQAGDGSAASPDSPAPPAGTPQAAGAPGRAVQGTSAPTAAPPLGSDPQSPTAAGQLAAQRNDAIGQGFPWLVLVGAVFLAGIVIAAASRVRKQRSR